MEDSMSAHEDNQWYMSSEPGAPRGDVDPSEDTGHGNVDPSEGTAGSRGGVDPQEASVGLEGERDEDKDRKR